MPNPRDSAGIRLKKLYTTKITLHYKVSYFMEYTNIFLRKYFAMWENRLNFVTTLIGCFTFTPK